MSDKLSRSLNLKYENIVQVDNSNLKEDNNDNTGAEQLLTIDVRLERRPGKTCHKNPLRKKAGNLRTSHGSSSGSWWPFLRGLYKGKTADSAIKNKTS